MVVVTQDTTIVEVAVDLAVDSVTVTNLDRAVPDSIAISSWPLENWFHSWGVQLLGVLVTGLLVWLVSRWTLRRSHRQQQDENRLKAYRLLSAVCNEMWSSLDRVRHCLRTFGADMAFVIGAFTDHAREACLERLVELEKDPKVLGHILGFYESLGLISTHHNRALDCKPKSEEADERHQRALAFMENKYEEMIEHYGHVWVCLDNKAADIDEALPHRIEPPEVFEEESESVLDMYRRALATIAAARGSGRTKRPAE